jgi:hypothetical protein
VRRDPHVLVIESRRLTQFERRDESDARPYQSEVVAEEDPRRRRSRAARAQVLAPDAVVADPDPVRAGIASVASMRGPLSLAAVTCQHTRSANGPPTVGPSGPSIDSLQVISYSRSIT